MPSAISAGTGRNPGKGWADPAAFWKKICFGVAALAVLGFGQFALRGFVNVSIVPWWVHVHGVVMLAWLGIFALQPWLATSGNLAMHRWLGRFAALLAVALVALAMATALLAMPLGRIPPVQTPGYFLAMNTVTLTAFLLLLGAALWNRRRVLSHQRLMVAATVMVIDPGIARMLPVPLIDPWTEMAVMVVQLGLLAIVLRHDYRTLGRAHGATLAAMLVIAVAHILIEVLGRMPAVHALGNAIAEGR